MEPKPTGITLPMWAKVSMVLVTIVLLALGTIYLMGISERGRWERYAAKLRDAGEPLTFEEIEARRADLPDERNSALVIEAAFEKFPPDPDSSSYLRSLRDVLLPEDYLEGVPQYVIDDARVFIEKHRPLLNALRPVMDMPIGRLSVAVAKKPFDMPMTSFRRVYTVSSLVRLDAILRLLEGDAGEAVDATVLQLHIAGSLNEYPNLIGHLGEIGYDRLGLDTTQDLLRAGEVVEGNLLRLRDAIAARRRENPMRWSVWSQRATAVADFNLIAAGELKIEDVFGPDTSSAPPFMLRLEFFIRRNQILSVEMLTRLADAGEDLAAVYETASQLDVELSQRGGTYYLAKMLVMMPSLRNVVDQQMELEATRECTLAAIAAERHRLAMGRWPATLDELVPAYLGQVPIDPFAERQPLKLAVNDQGIVIYSIGDDSIDDGGEVVAAGDYPFAPDLGFRLLDPEHRGVVITDEPRPEEGD